MTPERKAEVNRRLAEFEGWQQIRSIGEDMGFYTLYGDHPVLPSRMPLPDYTDDLNALAQLENKAADWYIWKITKNIKEPSERRYRAVLVLKGFVTAVTYGETEAEARAEAICQYLEYRDEEKISAR